MKRTMWIAAAVVGLGLAGCGESKCEQLGNLICERAADCAGDGTARFGTATGGATITFDNEGDCKTLYVSLGCSGDGDIVVDPEACIADVEAAACVMTPSGMALEYPQTPACDDPPSM